MPQQNPNAKPAGTGTGPLNPAEVGQFSYRDGVWFLNPSQATTGPLHKPHSSK